MPEEVMNKESEVETFLRNLARGKYIGSLTLANATLNIIEKIIGSDDWKTANQLMKQLVDSLGPTALARQSSACASEVLVGNLLRRVLKLIREEHTSALRSSKTRHKDEFVVEQSEEESLHKMVVAKESEPGKEVGDLALEVPDLRSRVSDAISELRMELETSSEEISNQALEHIHANEVILTIGKSKTVELFLKHAAKERKFQVIIAENAPFYHGHELAMSLGESKIQTTVITDSAIFAVMSRVNKVIMGTNAILANGGLKALSGSHTVALAAKHYSVPLYVCASMLKLTPSYYKQEDPFFNKFVSPELTALTMDGEILSRVEMVTPVFEYVPPELVTLFISNVSGHAPSYVYRLLSELYHPKDYELTS